MPLRDKRASAPDEARRSPRELLEHFCRAVALVGLAALLLVTVYALYNRPAARASGDDVRDALVRWSSKESPEKVHVVLDSAPNAEVRDWIAAFPGANTEATWDGAVPAAAGVSVEPVVDPTKRLRVWVGAPSGTSVVISDSIAILDSAVAKNNGALFLVPRLVGPVHATVNRSEATAAARDSVVLRSILILGMAHWEGKFIMASLEELGWKVDARFGLAPSGDVRAGAEKIQIDTSKYAAIIALDSVAYRYTRQIKDFVRSGGGFIATGMGSALTAFSDILPARAEPAGLIAEFADDSLHPRNALSLAILEDVKAGAVVIEKRRGDNNAVVAWRVGDGRVIQNGYHDTWRWRMAGLDGDPVRNYRQWWGSLTSSVAFAPRFNRQVAQAVEPTPLASMVSTLGQPVSQGAAFVSVLDNPKLLPLLFTIVMVALFMEWISRRFRGRA